MDDPSNVVNTDQKSQSNCFYILIILDHIVSLVVIAPFVVTYWRGCWDLCDIYIYPSDAVISAFISTSVGILLGILMCVLGTILEDIYTYELYPFKYILLSRTYIFIYCFGTVNHWRGVWHLLDELTGISIGSAIACIVTGLSLLMATRGLNNIMWVPPYIICTDHEDGMYSIPTMLSKSTENFRHRLLDVTYTVTCVGNLVIFVWRGVWTLLNILFFPKVLLNSALGSLSIGLVLTFLGLLVQIILGPGLKKLNYGRGKMVLEYLFYIVSCVAVLNIWRGYWGILDVCLLHVNVVSSNITSFIIGIGVPMLLFCSNSIMSRGAVKDSEEIGINYQNEYISVLYRKMLEKNILKAPLLQSPS